MTPEELKQTLEGLGLEGMEVTVDGRPGHLVAVVQSPVFTNMEEHARQLIIWEYLLRKLTDEQRIEVEFVFTASRTTSSRRPSTTCWSPSG